MSIVLSDNISSVLKDRYILLDTCFLSEQLHDEEFLKKSFSLFSESYLIIEPLVKLEFLRDIFLPGEKFLRKKFIEKDAFIPAPLHADIYQKIFDNALTISRLYKQNNNRHRATPKLVDLILVARIVLTNFNYLLITRDVNHFPAILFDLVATIVVRQDKESELRSFGVLELNVDKFNGLLDKLKVVDPSTLEGAGN